jgi:23S rRNA (adenine2503-C2)-methyltransferase
LNPWTSIREIRSKDRNVSKFVFENHNAVAESVLYKYPTFKDRTVICCSTMSGCPVGCRFCGAGDNFVRSLTSKEIISQPEHLLKSTGVDPFSISKLQIMFMSMGEPLLNMNHLLPALTELNGMYPNASLLISTSGPRVDYERFRSVSREIRAIGLQFSVHESSERARNELVPFKAKLSLAEISVEGEKWAKATGRRPFFNYCAHERNNTPADVERLRVLFDPSIWEATISVICEREESVAAANLRQQELASGFMTMMLEAGYSARMSNPAGQDDIGGGCGQLWFTQEWMRDHSEFARPSIGFEQQPMHAPKI